MRLKTLAASLVPVFLGCFIAWVEGVFSPLPILALFSAALLIQVASNFANDVIDFEKGTDTEDRLGPVRAVQAGLIEAKTMKRATALVLVLALLIGLYLVSLGGTPILIIGLLSLFFAWGYTAGPFPLAYLGLGEVFVMIFFGPTAVMGSYYVLTKEVSIDAFFVGLSTGAIASAILVVNNLRDIEGDTKSEKNTLAVRFGPRFAQYEYVLLLIVAALSPLVGTYFGSIHSGGMLAGLYFLFAIPLVLRIFRQSGEELNTLLADTAKLLFVFAACYCLGLQV